MAVRGTQIGQYMMKKKLSVSTRSTLVIQHGGLSERDFLLVQLYEEWPSVLNPGTVQCYTEQSERICFHEAQPIFLCRCGRQFFRVLLWELGAACLWDSLGLSPGIVYY